jgi:hypothetical protein
VEVVGATWPALQDQRLGVDDALKPAAAHRLQEETTLGKAGTLTGKIVVTPEP